MIVERPARESDFAFIVDTWRRSFEGAPQVRGADDAWMKREIAHAVRRLTVEGHGVITMACDSEDDDTLIGWAAMSPPVLHYVYVRADFRRQGIARSLLRSSTVELTGYTCRTLPGERRLGLAARGMSFQPPILSGLGAAGAMR